MKKQKLIVLFAFLLIVSGTMLFLSEHVYGLSSCYCSPDFQPGDGLCYPGDYFHNWYQADSYCLFGECKFQIDVYCETPGGYAGDPYYRLRIINIAIMTPGCCDHGNSF